MHINGMIRENLYSLMARVNSYRTAEGGLTLVERSIGRIHASFETQIGAICNAPVQ